MPLPKSAAFNGNEPRTAVARRQVEITNRLGLHLGPPITSSGLLDGSRDCFVSPRASIQHLRHTGDQTTCWHERMENQSPPRSQFASTRMPSPTATPTPLQNEHQ